MSELDDSDEERTRPADARLMLLAAMAVFEARFELLQKKLPRRSSCRPRR